MAMAMALPPDQTPTPCREREWLYLGIIDTRDAKICRRAKRIERLTLRLDQAREALAARDAAIAGKEQTISENAAALAEMDRTIAEGAEALAAKDAITASLTEDVEHLQLDNADALSMLSKKAHISDLCLQLDTTGAAEMRREVCTLCPYFLETALAISGLTSLD
ncbi:hypothetical protein GSI_11720 [Ganoderma sinense ZZ0214-1]|uniref:Uncharacterized protein n=1 Tax=Ganoderma sinense ZZ0214-1 TaxID=1077348 RepID=A0A2G8RWS1_9APHY|nr:hypothetical protein GSI_11720 [Ganoderma sinense ZZ0214-1]